MNKTTLIAGSFAALSHMISAQTAEKAVKATQKFSPKIEVIADTLTTKGKVTITDGITGEDLTTKVANLGVINGSELNPVMINELSKLTNEEIKNNPNTGLLVLLKKSAGKTIKSMLPESYNTDRNFIKEIISKKYGINTDTITLNSIQKDLIQADIDANNRADLINKLINGKKRVIMNHGSKEIVVGDLEKNYKPKFSAKQIEKIAANNDTIPVYGLFPKMTRNVDKDALLVRSPGTLFPLTAEQKEVLKARNYLK